MRLKKGLLADIELLRRHQVQLPVVGFACALALLLLVGLASYLDARRLADTTAQLDETHSIIERLDAVAIAVERIVTAARVFVLTGTEDVVVPIAQARREMVENLAALREMLAGTEQLGNLDALEELVVHRVNLSHEYIDLRRRLDLQETTDEIQPEGERISADIRTSISDIQQTIRLRLNRRRSAASAAHAETLITITLFGCTSFVVLLAAFMGSRKQATERAKLEGEIVAAGERERDRIARDLHDGLGQELTGMSLRLKALSKELQEEQSTHAETLDALSGLMQASVSETRRLSRSLSPSVGSNLGLCAALESLAQEVDEYSDVDCDSDCSEADDIDDGEVAAQLFRIAQEAVNNALRHGKPKKIKIRYGREGKTGYLMVCDDGAGIPPLPDRVEGLGLKSMRYRARMIGGNLDVKMRDHGGTEVRCSFSMPGG